MEFVGEISSGSDQTFNVMPYVIVTDEDEAPQ